MGKARQATTFEPVGPAPVLHVQSALGRRLAPSTRRLAGRRPLGCQPLARRVASSLRTASRSPWSAAAPVRPHAYRRAPPLGLRDGPHFGVGHRRIRASLRAYGSSMPKSYAKRSAYWRAAPLGSARGARAARWQRPAQRDETSSLGPSRNRDPICGPSGGRWRANAIYCAWRDGTRLAVTVTSTSHPGGTSRKTSARVRTGTLGCLSVPKYWL